jgi:hypothetical protein
MKAKLVKTENGYGLEDVEIIAFYSSKRPEHKHYKLSKQNCDEIFGVVNVEKLTQDSYQKYSAHDNKISLDEQIQRSGGFIVGFKEGFNKAMELNKDKVFTIENIEEAFAYGQLNQVHNQKYFSGSKTYIQSLQQPTEIDVEIVMETKQQLVNGYKNQPENVIGFVAEYENILAPKLDSEGCLILKKL